MDMPDINPEVPENAVSLYGSNGALDDFPVLKAFQQYIDAEQAKARKRLVIICALFGFLTVVIISVFMILLVNVSSHNQALNDRLFEFAMKERERPSGSAVVVQPPQDSSAIMALTGKLDDLQKKLAETQAMAEKKSAEAEAARKEAAEAAQPKQPTAAEKEVERLKALLAAEKEKTSAEKEKKRQEELEAYRRKHYPELYRDSEDDDDDLLEEEPARRKPIQKKPIPRKNTRRATRTSEDIDALLKEVDAIKYFDDDAEDDEAKAEAVPPSPPPAPAPEKNYSIPVDVQGSSGTWSVPLE